MNLAKTSQRSVIKERKKKVKKRDVYNISIECK